MSIKMAIISIILFLIIIILIIFIMPEENSVSKYRDIIYCEENMGNCYYIKNSGRNKIKVYVDIKMEKDDNK